MENTEDMAENSTKVSATTPKSGCQQSQNQSWYILGFLFILLKSIRHIMIYLKTNVYQNVKI